MYTEASKHFKTLFIVAKLENTIVDDCDLDLKSHERCFVFSSFVTHANVHGPIYAIIVLPKTASVLTFWFIIHYEEAIKLYTYRKFNVVKVITIYNNIALFICTLNETGS